MNKPCVLVAWLLAALVAVIPVVSVGQAAARESANAPVESAGIPESYETEEPAGGHEDHETMHLAHRLAFFTGNTVVPDGETRSGVLVVPTFGLDYQYWFAHRWAAMASFEIELLNYTVETEEGKFINRDTPVVLAALGVFEPVDRLGLLLGGGIELEEHQSLWLVRIGGEYAFPVQNDWDISITVYGDIKKEFWGLTTGLTIGKRM